MQISWFRGSRTVMSLRLCSRAPWTTSSSAAIGVQSSPRRSTNKCSFTSREGSLTARARRAPLATGKPAAEQRARPRARDRHEHAGVVARARPRDHFQQRGALLLGKRAPERRRLDRSAPVTRSRPSSSLSTRSAGQSIPARDSAATSGSQTEPAQGGVTTARASVSSRRRCAESTVGDAGPSRTDDAPLAAARSESEASDRGVTLVRTATGKPEGWRCR